MTSKLFDSPFKAAHKNVDQIIMLLAIRRWELWQIHPEIKLLEEFEGPISQGWKSVYTDFADGAVYEVREYVKPPHRTRFDGITPPPR